MDDVDRLFQCFKCGISPPPSALRERKRSKNRLKQDCSKQEVASSSGLFSPGSAGNGHKSATDVHFSSEKLGSSTVKAKGSNSGKQISPVVFYGTPHGVPPKRPLSLLRLLREIRVDLSKEDSSNLGKEIWATFPRQNEAIMFAKGHANGLPCHLYFDLEFNKRVNPQKHGDEMVDLLISVTLEALFDKYSIKGDEDWIVELDSSTEEKFSRHLIIRIPKTAFKDNSHAGAFVAECEEDMFMASLICNMDADCEKLLVCKMELDCVKTLQFDTEVHDNLGKYCRASQECALSACSSVGKSPFPALDKFVECIASTGNDPGKIRSWYWFSEYGLIVYSMSRNRYCERIGREHKSNHGYRSPLRPIPMDPIPDLPFSSDSEHMVHHGGSSHNNTEYQFVKNDEKHDLLYDDERDTESYCKDSWWIEAVKFANDVENKKMTCELGNLANNDDEDDNWWMVVEQTASHAELISNFKVSSMASTSNFTKNQNPNNPKSPIFISADSLHSILSHSSLIQHFHSSLPKLSPTIQTPIRQNYAVSPPSSLLLMPSWSSSPSLPYIGVKLVTSFPQNSSVNLPGIHASYVLFSSTNGQTLASMDGTVLTLYRTACVSGLASKILARNDSKVLVMIGAGNLAPHLIKAHLAARPSLKRVIIWNRTMKKASDLAEHLSKHGDHNGVCFESNENLEEILQLGDIVSCATNSEVPLVRGGRLKVGAHLDLVGSYKHTMRECDDEAVKRGRVFVDNEAALVEAGELVGAFERGVIREEDIAGNLVELIEGKKMGRRDDDEVTVFKSVGSGVVDLLAAQLMYEAM
ncbi:hypothetical protein CUMW_090890 [Citrus unshiu]|nr:hypothetical protein CUMW_090890 [Citrus unshiu]